MRSHALFVAIALSAFDAGCFSARGEPKVEETVVGPVGSGGLYVVSQNDARIAYVGAKGTRTVVTVDGVEGPQLDELFGGSAAIISSGNQILVHNANAGGKLSTPTAVIFSEKGSHFAYIGRQGNDYVVVHDGKEAGRAPRPLLGLQHTPLSLSPGGNFVYWEEMKIEGGRGTYRLVVNGKPEAWAGHQDLVPVFSPDDKHYAYTAGTVEDNKKQILIIDGKVANYVGYSPQWTADSKVLLTVAPGNGVLVDGKPGPYTGIQLESITPSTVGGRFAVIMRKKNVNYEGVGTLYLDGEEVPGTEGAKEISFSPDGKHWALRCINPEAKSAFMVIDGKKGYEYQTVDKAYWTPDSSKVIYSISSSGRNFVVVNNEEIAVQMVSSLMRGPFVTPKQGGRYAFSSFDGANRNHLTIVDGKNVLPAGHAPDGDSVEFSDNGERYAFTVNLVGRNGQIGIVDNGTLNTALSIGMFAGHGASTARTKHFILSPDGKYLTRIGYTPQNAQGLYVNEKLVYPVTNGINHATYTPDSKHLFWLAGEKASNGPGFDRVIYVDGQAAARISGQHLFGVANTWKMGANGVLTCLGVVGDVVKRFRITPAAEMDIDKMVVEAAEKQAEAIAVAAAAKKKAEDDAIAAAAKKKADDEEAAAMRKAAADEAAAKRRADLQAAAEAKAKARADAAAAKAAARQKK